MLSNVQTNQAGIYAVTVTNLYGTAVSSNAVLTVTNPVNNVPVIISFSPILGATGTVVNITGLNFSATTSNNIVRFGGVAATVCTAILNCCVCKSARRCDVCAIDTKLSLG